MANVFIKGNSIASKGTEVYIDGQKLHGVASIDFITSIDDINRFNFQLNGIPDIETRGRCDFGFTVETIQQACRVLTHMLETEEIFYNSFISSIESALRESTVVWDDLEYKDTAKKVADRIIGIG